MADKVSVTSHNSYWSRVKNSAKSIWGWIIFVIISILLLARNEHNFVEQKKALEEWSKLVQETSSETIDSSLNWKEVYLNWQTSSEAESLKDGTFWITVDDLKLSRDVQMYQREEDEDTKCTDNVWWSEDCTTTYEYYKTWSDNKIDSSRFQETNWHSNPINWEYESNEWVKSPIKLGAYTLSTTFVNLLTNYKPIDLNEQEIIVPEKYKVEIKTENSVESNNDSYLYWDSTWNAENKSIENNTNAIKDYEKFHIYQDHIYVWTDENEPEIWDLKITFSSVKEWTVSVIWMQQDSTLTSYKTSNDRNIALLEDWVVSADNMFMHAQQANKTLTWILRIIGLLMMYTWFTMIFQLVETITKVLPFLSKIVWFGTRTIAFALTLALWFLTIWIARLAVRPVIWIICLVIAAGWIFLLIKNKENKKENYPNWWIDTKKESKNDSNTEIIEC